MKYQPLQLVRLQPSLGFGNYAQIEGIDEEGRYIVQLQTEKRYLLFDDHIVREISKPLSRMIYPLKQGLPQHI